MNRKPLELTFDPLTIEHLGSNMYSRLPNAVAELVANAYDAEATQVEVRISGSVPVQTITVADNGHGMSWEDLNEKYLRIGRNRRDEQGLRSEGGGRRVSGKKGLGKLALFGIGSCVKIQTTRQGSAEATLVTLDWEVLRNSEKRQYEPLTDLSPISPHRHGTSVTVSRLARKTAISPTDLAVSLSRLFHYGPNDLKVTVVGPDGRRQQVKSDLDFDELDVEFEWKVPGDLEGKFVRVLEEWGIIGRIVATEKPLRGHARGVVVYANGRLANEPEFFGASASSHAYAYITGHIDIDRLDEFRPDVIATDRRAVNWDHPSAALIHDALGQAMTFIGTNHRRRRQAKKEEAVRDKTGSDSQEWVDSVHGPAKAGLAKVMNVVNDEDSHLSSTERRVMLEGLEALAPPYADLYWQDLHPWVQEACERLYKKTCYHEAINAAWNRYVSMAVELAGGDVDDDDRKVFSRVFGRENQDGKTSPRLSVTAAALSKGIKLRANTVNSLEDGQRELSFGVSAAFRNPIVHEDAEALDECGLLTYRQALDALGVISLLCTRLELSLPRSSGDSA